MQKHDGGYVLLDRDGTIIVNKHYQRDPAVTELLPNAKEGLDLLRSAGFSLVMITNQSGIARGLLTREDLEAVNASVIEKLGGDGRYFAGVYHCPHVREDGCDCRKPLPGMIFRAAKELGFDAKAAFVVGDRDADIAAGAAAGATTVLVRTGYGSEEERKGTARPDYVADDLLDAARWIAARGGASGRK